jgi:phage gpG-like protein
VLISGTFDEGDLLRGLGAGLTNPARLMKRLGLLIATRGKQAFGEQKRGPFVWKPRHVPNVPGILADLSDGKKTIPNRRFEARPALEDKGRLLADLSSAEAVHVEGTYRVSVGSRLPYASLHQFGGEVDIPISDTLKAKIAALLKSSTKKADRAMDRAMGWAPSSGDFEGAAKLGGRADMLREALAPLLRKNVHGLTWRVPARPFVVVTDEDMGDLKSMAIDDLMRGKAA